MITVPSGQYDQHQLSVVVDDVPPTIVSLVPQDQFLMGHQGRFLATVTDPGIYDSLTYTWDFGDGTPTVTGVDLSAPVHTYAALRQLPGEPDRG